MDTRTRRYLISGASLLGGFLLVALVTFVVRPLQTDGAHLMGTLTVKGGVVIHAGEFELGKGLFGWYTANLTGTAAPPIQGDITVAFEGPSQLNYIQNSRLPPGLPISNKGHPWYELDGATLRNVSPGDRVAINLRMQAPAEAGEYKLVLRNAKTQQVYLTMPITFKAAAETATAAEEPCH
jgi:hypothetical protein